MCVIAYKPKKAKFPSEKNVREMWKSNPDGAGAMWRNDDGTVGFVKGFMKLEHFEKWIAENKAWLEEFECALHFRITTHGGTSPGNCHPFVCASDADPHLLSGSANRVLMHNGVLSLIPRAKDVSDSAELALRLGKYSDPCGVMKTFDEQLYGNRIVVFDADGAHFFGDAFRKSECAENDGILYSNLNWEKPRFDDWFSHCGYGGANVRGDFLWDDKSQTWRESLTNRAVNVEEVDPWSLSEDDYELWEIECGCLEDEEFERREFGLSRKEYEDLKTEAESFGMSVRDYVEQAYETEDETCLA